MNELPKSWSEARSLGSKFYMTGKPCRFGNIAPRLSSAGICRCKDCKKLYSDRANAEQKKNPERVRETSRRFRTDRHEWIIAYRRDYRDRYRIQNRTSHLLRNYGITEEIYQAAYIAQGGKCAMCKVDSADAPRKRLAVDHCHKTGRVRGLLCDTCNKELGVIEKYRNKLDEMLFYADHATLQSGVGADADNHVSWLQAELIATRTLCGTGG